MNNSKAIGEELEHYMERTGVLSRELADLKHKIWGLQQMVEFQTADEGLWHIDATAPEAYLQDALRKLHHCIEQACTLANDSKEESDDISQL